MEPVQVAMEIDEALNPLIETLSPTRKLPIPPGQQLTESSDSGSGGGGDDGTHPAFSGLMDGAD